MPKLSDMMEEGKVLSWSKKVGDTIKKGDALGEVETEKVNIEIESFFSGTLLQLLVEPGTTVPIGAAIALIGAANEQPTSAPTSTAPAAQPVASTATTAINGNQPQQYGNGNGASHTSEAVSADAGRVKISPLARRLAEEHRLDITSLQGSGPEGRIIKEDIEAALASASARPAATVTASQPTYTPTPQPQPAYTPPTQTRSPVQQNPVTVAQNTVQSGEVEIVPLTNMRRTIARRLQESAQTLPHFYVTMAMDATNLSETRQQLNKALEHQGQAVKVSYNDLIVMAVARTLANHSEINASFDGERILRHKTVNVGVAVALETGLIVPVVREANKRTATDLSKEIKRLVDAARTNKLRPDEFQGGTFTISNLGMMDVENFTAIINPPESAILAVGAVHQVPVVVDGQVVVRDQIKMTLSSDHRVIDGLQAARFMQDLKALIETPATLML